MSVLTFAFFSMDFSHLLMLFLTWFCAFSSEPFSGLTSSTPTRTSLPRSRSLSTCAWIACVVTGCCRLTRNFFHQTKWMFGSLRKPSSLDQNVCRPSFSLYKLRRNEGWDCDPGWEVDHRRKIPPRTPFLRPPKKKKKQYFLTFLYPYIFFSKLCLSMCSRRKYRINGVMGKHLL